MGQAGAPGGIAWLKPRPTLMNFDVTVNGRPWRVAIEPADQRRRRVRCSVRRAPPHFSTRPGLMPATLSLIGVGRRGRAGPGIRRLSHGRWRAADRDRRKKFSRDGVVGRQVESAPSASRGTSGRTGARPPERGGDHAGPHRPCAGGRGRPRDGRSGGRGGGSHEDGKRAALAEGRRGARSERKRRRSDRSRHRAGGDRVMPLRFKRFERVRSHFAFRFTRLGVVIFAIALAVAIVTTLTVDLGPALRALAEREGSRRIERPMHIGSLSVRLFSGKFVLEDFVIEGLAPTDRPFLRAKRLEVSLAWQAMLHSEVLLDSIGDDRLADAGRAVGERPAQLSEVRIGPQRPAPVHHHAAVRAGAGRRVHLRGPRHALEHRGAEPRRQRDQGARLSGRGQLFRRHRRHPELRPDARRHESHLPRRRRHRPFRSHQSEDRRRRVRRDHRRCRRRALARADLSREFGRGFPPDARDFLRARKLHALGRGPLQRPVPSLQERARADRQLHQRRARPRRRRPRLSVPGAQGQARVAARSP